MTVLLNGVTWRRVQIEVSPDEGHAGTAPEQIPSLSLAGFGLPIPDHLVSLSMLYQIAQKVHASTDPHDPPAFVNDRAPDVWTCCCCAPSLRRPGIRRIGQRLAGSHRTQPVRRNHSSILREWIMQVSAGPGPVRSGQEDRDFHGPFVTAQRRRTVPPRSPCVSTSAAPMRRNT
jgi:hypothetical protein